VNVVNGRLAPGCAKTRGYIAIGLDLINREKRRGKKKNDEGWGKILALGGRFKAAKKSSVLIVPNFDFPRQT